MGSGIDLVRVRFEGVPNKYLKTLEICEGQNGRAAF